MCAYVLALASRNSKPDEKHAAKRQWVSVRPPSALPLPLLTVLVSKLFGLLVRHVSLGLQVGLVPDQDDDLKTRQAAGEPGPGTPAPDLQDSQLIWLGPGQRQKVDSASA